MKFVLNGKEVFWRGQSPEAKPRLSLMQAQNLPTVVLDKLLAEFANLFMEPYGLPSSCECELCIPLLSGSVIVRLCSTHIFRRMRLSSVPRSYNKG